MSPLPIDAIVPQVLDALRHSRALVLVAPPGSGKTTRVPPALVRSGLLGAENPVLTLLQPRRVAARASAARIAEENGWTLGREVGYQVRFERKIGPETTLRVVTEGILTRQLVADPFLSGVGAVVLDEFHERSLHTDLALALLRAVRDAVRDDLIVVVMSATLDAEPVARFLGGYPVLRAEGRTFPVTVSYRPFPTRTPLAERVGVAVEECFAGDDTDRGDVLVFLPGAEEIRRSARRLGDLASRENLAVLPLHGSLPSDEQDRALRPSDRRKVVLATNVAETSLTIDGVTTVVDSGLARFASHDVVRGLDRLTLGRISRASADQRAGRAGRTGPGRCVRLWSEREQRGLVDFDVPEIHRVDLASTVLALYGWGLVDLAGFSWYEPPSPEALAGAERLLRMLGAFDGGLTRLGKRLLSLPVHPRLGRLLLAAAEAGLVHQGAGLAALLSERDLVPPGSGGEPRRGRSDLLERLDLLEQGGARVDPIGRRRVQDVRRDLLRLVRHHDLTRSGPDVEEDLLRLVLRAYPDRVCRRRGPREAAGVMVGGRGVRLEPESVVREADLFLALDPRDDRRGGTREARVRIASEVRVEWLHELFPEAITRERTVVFDESRGRAIARDTIRYRDMILRQEAHRAVTPAEASTALASALAAQASTFLRDDPAAAAWLDRLACLRSWMPEAGLPDWGEAELAEVVADACQGRVTVEEVRRVPLVPLLKGRLTHAQNRWLEEHAPEELTVPSGRRLRLAYAPGQPPTLAVRLQEVFGWIEAPRIAGGKVAVVLHLLGPHHRPVQITDDLRSFWQKTYLQVRKDLRARYPRHSWPEDPFTARPEAQGGRRP